MAKIKVKNPLVEIDGDEMTRVMWKMIKDDLLLPFLDIEQEYYDLHIENRDLTNDQITTDAARAILRHKVGVKCATITPEAKRVQEYKLKKQWASPNGTIRNILGGTVFRAPILVSNIKPAVRSWKKPIVIGRHAYGDVYANVEIPVPGPGLAEIIFTPEDGKEPIRRTIHKFSEAGVIQGAHNLDQSIRGFAKSCFIYGLDQKMDVWLGVKDTISKIYDGRFRDIFFQIYEEEFKSAFEGLGITFFFTLIDDAVARVMKDPGGFLWACKNYDGDVMSDMLASAFGSLAMMTSVLVSPEGCYEYEAAHGTVQRHYYKHLTGETTSSNPMALIFAWTGALNKRGELDSTPEVCRFAKNLENAAIETIEAGRMTGDMSRLADPAPSGHLSTAEFIAEVAVRLRDKI
jgi:isocitrate dehydrogenase